VVLSDPELQYCTDCLPKFKDRRTDKLVGAARRVLVEMRGSQSDPAQTAEAKAKRIAAYVERKERARAWLHENPGPPDRNFYKSEILPGLPNVTLPQMIRATSLTSGYCWKIQRGDRIPHPMYWEVLRSLAGDHRDRSPGIPHDPKR